MSGMSDSKGLVIWLVIWGWLFMASGNRSGQSSLSPGKSSSEATLESWAGLKPVWSHPGPCYFLSVCEKETRQSV